MAKYGVDMREGSVLKNHLRFALPLMATSVLQLFYNAADQVVVGQFTGSHALAAIGATGSLNLLIINLFMGLSIGAGIVISRKYGAGDLYGLKKTAHSAVGVSFIMGFIALIAGIVFCRPLLRIMGTPENVIDLSVLYMRILFIGAPFVMVYNFGAAILRAVGDTKRPLYILSVTGIVNVLLNLLLVIVFHLGVAGVAIATITANFLSASAVLYTLSKSDAPYRITFKNIKIFKDDVMDFIKIGLPAGVQSIMYNVSNAILQSAINGFGTTVMAANTAAGGLEGFVYVSTNAFYQSTLTSVGQNYGAKNKKRIYKTLGAGICCTTAAALIISTLFMIFARQLLGIYIADNPAAIEVGLQKMFITTIPYFLIGIMEQFGALLNGLGKAINSAVNAFVGTCLSRIVWALLIFPLNPTYNFLNMAYPVSWVITIILNVVVFLFIKKKAMAQMMA